MNRLVRQVAKDIRHRPLPDLISHPIPIRSLDTVVEDTSAWLALKVPWPIRFQGPEQKYLGFSVVKYGILDLTFRVDGLTWNGDDAPGVTLLKEFGFVFHADELSKDTRHAMADDEDPTCLAQLRDDIAKNETVMRLFFKKRPVESSNLGYLKSQILSGRLQTILSAKEQGEEHLRRIADECFPGEYTVSDACLTNADFIWFHKHSYL